MRPFETKRSNGRAFEIALHRIGQRRALIVETARREGQNRHVIIGRRFEHHQPRVQKFVGIGAGDRSVNLADRDITDRAIYIGNVIKDLILDARHDFNGAHPSAAIAVVGHALRLAQLEVVCRHVKDSQRRALSGGNRIKERGRVGRGGRL